MARPKRVAPELPQHIPDGPVDGDRIRHGSHRLETKPCLVAHHDASTVRALTALILCIVVARGVRLPNIDTRADDRIPGGVPQGAADEHGLTFAIATDGAAVLEGDRIVCVEGAEHGPLGCARRLRVVHGVNEHREAERVGKEDELLARVAAFLPRRGEEIDRGHPFVGGEPRFARKVVQVRHQLRHDVLETLVGALRVNEERVRGDVLGGKVEHWGDCDGGGIHCGGWGWLER